MKRISTSHPNAIKIFIEALKNNKVIAYPTDTIYGVGTDMNNNLGIDRINKMKRRSQPMSIVLGNFNLIKDKISESKENLTNIENKIEDGSTFIAKYHTGYFNEKITKDGKIGFRIPNHNFLKAVLNIYNKPITTTSVNETGLAPMFSPDEIEKKFNTEIDLIFDEGVINNKPSKIFVFEENKLIQTR